MGELHAKLGVGSGMWEVTTGYESCGIEGARLRYPWVVAGPGQAPPVWRAPEGPAAVPVGSHGSRPGNTQTPDRLEAAAWPAGPGRASSRRTSHTSAHPAPPVWRPPRGLRGLAAVAVGGGRARAGLEIDHSEPSGSRVAISRAGRRPPAHTAARPIKADPTAAPGPAGTRVRKGAGTEVPAPCRLTQPLPRRGLRPNDRQSWRRRRIHRNMPPTTAAPRPAPPIRPSKPVRARPCFGLVAGTSGAT